jgi:hypothetical protein
MRRSAGHITFGTSILIVALLLPSIGFAQAHHHPAVPPHGGGHRGHVVFVGGYFYDPFWGPYPWWPHPAYPYPYFPTYDNRAVLRVLATPKNAGVYVDGFYAGIVDDFNGFFESLPLPPGGHEVVLYLEGYRTVRQHIYLSPGSTFKLNATMERVPAGEVSEPPRLAPPLPPPPEGSAMPPRTPPRLPPPVGTAQARPASAAGTLTLHVQPSNADVRIDGERWESSDTGRYEIQLASGPHRIDVTSPGYHDYSTEVVMSDGQTLPLNVSLVRGQS